MEVASLKTSVAGGIFSSFFKTLHNLWVFLLEEMTAELNKASILRWVIITGKHESIKTRIPPPFHLYPLMWWRVCFQVLLCFEDERYRGQLVGAFVLRPQTETVHLWHSRLRVSHCNMSAFITHTHTLSMMHVLVSAGTWAFAVPHCLADCSQPCDVFFSPAKYLNLKCGCMARIWTLHRKVGLSWLRV